MSTLSKIGAYEILSELGQGGFGKVFKAFDPKVGREVAIKVLTASGDPSVVSRFRVEATAAGNLRHKNIITIYEFGEEGSLYYLVTEYLRGRDLAHILQSGTPLSVFDTVNIMNQVAQGLHYAHEHQVVHRDVKPGNIMLLDDGSVKIMDFGIARLSGTDQHRLTKSGMLVGTLLYMAPEQFVDTPNDALCDIWAYGVMYYELLARVHPFEAPDQASIMYKITTANPPPIRTYRPDCPPELEQIVMRLLSKNREARYQTLEDVVFDTEPLLSHLRKERARQLHASAETLIAGEQFEQAQQTIRQILELDPSDRQAREWRDQIRQQQRSSTLAPKIGELLKSAEFEISQKQYTRAIEIVSSALQLDPGNPRLQTQLQRLRQDQQAHQAVQQLLAQARQDFEAGRLTDALFRATEAASKSGSSAADPEAERLAGQIRVAMAERDRTLKLQATLKRADELAEQSDLDAAIELLVSQARDFPGEAQLAKRLRELQAEREAQRKQQEVASHLSTARQLLETARIEEALQLLEQLHAQVPNQTAITELLAFTKAEAAKKQEAAWIEKKGREAWGLAKQGQFEESLRIIDEVVKAHPDAEGMARVRSAVAKLRAESTAQRLAAPDPLSGSSPWIAGPPQPQPAAPSVAPATVVPAPAQPEQRRSLLIPALAAVVVLGAVGGYFALRTPPSPTVEQKPVQASTGQPVAESKGVPQSPDLPKQQQPVREEPKKPGAADTKDKKPRAEATSSQQAPPQRPQQEQEKPREVAAAKVDAPKVEPPREEPAPAPPPKPAPVTIRKVWNGDDAGQLRWRTPLLPGATVDLTRVSGMEGGTKFPWVTETKVRVRVISPASGVAIDVQPSGANDWNLIRIRNTTGQAIQVVTLAWEIPQ